MEKRTLVRYSSNRKIYDRERKAYVRLLDVDFSTSRIIDYRTKNDISYEMQLSKQLVLARLGFPPVIT